MRPQPGGSSGGWITSGSSRPGGRHRQVLIRVRRSATSIPATCRRMAAALSTMSRRRRAGFSGGREPLPVDGVLKRLGLGRLFDHALRTAEDWASCSRSRSSLPKYSKPPAAKPASKPHRDVDVRGCARIAPGDRAEDQHAADAERAQSVFVRPEPLDGRSRKVIHGTRGVHSCCPSLRPQVTDFRSRRRHRMLDTVTPPGPG